MSFKSFVGTFTSPASIATDTTVTGVGFKPKVIIIYSAIADDADTAEVHQTISYGAATSATNERSVSYFSEDAQGASQELRAMGNTIIYHVDLGGSGTIVLDANVKSLDIDGFTLDWTVINASFNDGREFAYIALGGDDLTNVDLSEFDTATTENTEVSFTGVGFKPDCVLFFTAVIQGNPPNKSPNAYISIGFAINPSKQACIGLGGNNAEGTTKTNRSQRTNRCMVVPKADDASGAVLGATHICMDSDGFTLNFLDYVNNSPTTAKAFFALSMKGPKFAVLNDTQGTSTGSNSATGAGFLPNLAHLLSFGNVASTAIENDSNMCIAAVSGCTQRYSAWGASEENVGTSDANRFWSTTKVLQMRSTAGTLQAEASFDGFNSDGLTLNWTTADSTARQWIGLLIGNTEIATAEQEVEWTINAHLDRKMFLRGTYDGTDTTWTMPIQDETIDAIVLGPDFGSLKGTVVTPSSVSSKTVTALGADYSSGLAVIGRNYTMDVTLTRPYLRSGEQQVVDAEVLIHKLMVDHYQTAGYDVLITQPGRADRTKSFAPRDTSVQIEEAGTHQFMIMGNAKDTVVSIRNTNAEPSNIVGIEWIVTGVPRTI